MIYCSPKNKKDWKLLRSNLSVRNYIRLRNRGNLCIFTAFPFPHIIDDTDSNVDITNMKHCSVKEFLNTIDNFHNT